MSLKSSAKGGGGFDPVPAGTHGAYCIAVIDLGKQHTEYKGQAKIQPKVILAFETPDETVRIEDDDKPMIIRQEYTNNLGDKANLRHHLVSWRGKEFTDDELAEFDLSKLPGVPCMISVVHQTSKTSGNVYGKITGISKLPKNMALPPMFNKPVVYDVANGRNAVFESLGEFTQKKIEQCDEWQHPDGEPAEDATAADDVIDGDEPEDDIRF